MASTAALDAALGAARAWLADDPDPETRHELDALIGSAGRGDTVAAADLVARFAGMLTFGTAGLRGALGAGPMRMNRVVVARAAAGLGRYLLDTLGPEACRAGVVVGFDARKNSAVFAADTAAVLGGMGIPTHLLPGPLPTPVTAFAIRHLDAVAGVMVTASHNPPQDNGYKVYLGDGAQIVPPVDADIAARIAAVGAVSGLVRDPSLTHRCGDEVIDAYLDAAVAQMLVPSARSVRVAYTAMHGVGTAVLVRAFARAGFPAPALVVSQVEPDPAFPTVAFPNPEEPGAMDRLLDLAAEVGADVALANDPDADRLGVAIPVGDPHDRASWRALRGDAIGWLIADHVLAHTSGAERLVVTSVVSSSLLARMAEAAGVQAAEVLTGFKWIARAALERPGTRFVFGYEEALGYLVGDAVRDKDGIGAALVVAEIAALARAECRTVADRLAAIETRFGRHVTAQRVVRMDPSAAAEAVAALSADPPGELAGEAVTEATWRADATLLTLRCGPGVRVMLRPSGTEPKLKIYGEAVGRDPEPFLDAVVGLLTA
jgi:phosphomannomutase